MPYMDNCRIEENFLHNLCETFQENNQIPASAYDNLNVKRGLRNADGTGVVAGVTLVGNVHGYLMNEGDVMPIPGELIYRGVNVEDIVAASIRENRFAFEETAYLLLLGKLPTEEQLASFRRMLEDARELPERFTEDVLINPGNLVTAELKNGKRVKIGKWIFPDRRYPSLTLPLIAQIKENMAKAQQQ